MKKFISWLVSILMIAASAFLLLKYTNAGTWVQNLLPNQKSQKTYTEKQIKAAKDAAAKKGNELIAQAKSLSPYETQVILRDTDGEPSSALAYAQDGDSLDNVLQIYVNGDDNLYLDVQTAVSLWEPMLDVNFIQIVDDPSDADVVVELAGSENSLELKPDNAGITYFNKKGSQGTHSYILIQDYINPAEAQRTTVIAHEIGHALGLAHREPDDSIQALNENNWDLMNTIVSTATPFAISNYDLTALRAAYQFWPETYRNYLK